MNVWILIKHIIINNTEYVYKIFTNNYLSIERLSHLLKEYFESHECVDIHEELVKAVGIGDLQMVEEILKRPEADVCFKFV